MEYEIYKLQEKKPLQEGSNLKRFIEAMMREHFAGVPQTYIAIEYNGVLYRVQDIDIEDTIMQGDQIIIWSEWKGDSVIITK